MVWKPMPSLEELKLTMDPNLRAELDRLIAEVSAELPGGGSSSGEAADELTDEMLDALGLVEVRGFDSLHEALAAFDAAVDGRPPEAKRSVTSLSRLGAVARLGQQKAGG